MSLPHFRSSPAPAHDAQRFVLGLGRALHTYGYSAHGLEEVMGEVAHRLGLITQIFSTPTSIMVAFGPQDEQQTFLMRVEPGDQDLGKLARLDHVIVEVMQGTLPPAQGARRVAEIVAAPPPYGQGLTTLAYGLSSGAVSRFLGGGLREAAVATVLGLLIGLLALAASRARPLGRVFEPVAAFVASAGATLAGLWLHPLSVFTTTLSGLIVLIPGLTLTVAMTELSSRHLVSGIARLSSAFMLFLTIAFGVALGGKLAAFVAGTPQSVAPAPLPGWTMLVALIVVPLAFTVLLRAEPRDAGWIVVSGVIAFYSSRLGTDALGVELGVFVGAFVVGAASNLYARLLDRPSTIPLVPGILLLVPGSIGYRSLAALLDKEVISGVETAFRMILMAVALVAGLMISNVVTPARRS
ncbi:MAG TPA: threonine/serine exporter family protein, partial [Gemmatimonadales bacterium]|nr:threonine/serine exporter family protein [Gemmatimonadales bacterium]